MTSSTLIATTCLLAFVSQTLFVLLATANDKQTISTTIATTTTTVTTATAKNSTNEKMDFVSLPIINTSQAQRKPSTSTKPLFDKCNKSNSKKCAKLREKEKHARANSFNDIWNDADLLQHPIDEEPRRINRTAGEMCLYSSDCISGCCMLDRETRIRSCQPKAMIGEKCTTAQIKGDLYVDVCPCESGDASCAYPGEYCTK